MTKIKLAKMAVTFIVGSGTTKIVAGIIKSNVSTEKITDQVAVTAAAWVIGSMAAQATKKFTDEKIDEIVDLWKTHVSNKS